MFDSQTPDMNLRNVSLQNQNNLAERTPGILYNEINLIFWPRHDGPADARTQYQIHFILF